MTMVDAVLSTYERVTDRTRKDKAFRAAEEKYGDMAGDPGLFSALQGVGFEAAQESDRAEAHDQTMTIRGNTEARTQDEYDFRRESADGERRQAAVLNLVEGLRSARDRGEDIGEAFDSLSKSLPGMGVAEEDIPRLREELIANPKILDDYYEALRSGQGKAGSAKDSAAAASGSSRAMTVFSDVLNRIDLLESEEMSSVGADVFGLPTPGKIIRSGGFGAYGSTPGTRSADFVNAMESLKSDIRSQAFETLKGGGQITEKESEFAANAIARLERTTSYPEFQRELKRLRAYMNALNNAAQRRANGETVGEVVWDDTSPNEDGVDRAEADNELVAGTRWTDPDTGKTVEFIGGDPADKANYRIVTDE